MGNKDSRFSKFEQFKKFECNKIYRKKGVKFSKFHKCKFISPLGGHKCEVNCYVILKTTGYFYRNGFDKDNNFTLVGFKFHSIEFETKEVQGVKLKKSNIIGLAGIIDDYNIMGEGTGQIDYCMYV